jgi:hypothetical protein
VDEANHANQANPYAAPAIEDERPEPANSQMTDHDEEGCSRPMTTRATAGDNGSLRRYGTTPAQRLLVRLLAQGPLPALRVQHVARQAGIPVRTLARAKAALQVASQRIGFGRGAIWYWWLPATPEAKALPPGRIRSQRIPALASPLTMPMEGRLPATHTAPVPAALPAMPHTQPPPVATASDPRLLPPLPPEVRLELLLARRGRQP